MKSEEKMSQEQQFFLLFYKDHDIDLNRTTPLSLTDDIIIKLISPFLKHTLSPHDIKSLLLTCIKLSQSRHLFKLPIEGNEHATLVEMELLNKLRIDYGENGSLDFFNLDVDPFLSFQNWFQEALSDKDIIEPNAMTLATCSLDGFPSARIVLLKEVDDAGFVFFTNYESQKGCELDVNPRAAIVFFWQKLKKQIRICGVVEKLDKEMSDEYFHTRPRSSQIGAWTSEQSRIIPSREFLEDRYRKYEDEYKDIEVPLPPFWGGYRVRPLSIEFWKGRTSRLHDRIKYTRENIEDNEWKIVRLSP